MTLHNDLIDELCTTPGIQRKGFKRALRKAVADGDRGNWCPGEFEKELRGVCKIPDAWSIDTEGRHVTCYEVEVTSHIKGRDCFAYGYLDHLLDYDHWTLTLVLVDKYGSQSELNTFWLDLAYTELARISPDTDPPLSEILKLYKAMESEGIDATRDEFIASNLRAMVQADG